MKKIFLVMLLAIAGEAMAARPTGRQIVHDYCRHLPNDIPLNPMMFKDVDSRRIIRSFLDGQQDAPSADTIYVITMSKISLSEYVLILRGDSILQLGEDLGQNKQDEEVLIIEAAHCLRSRVFVDEYLLGLQRMDFSVIDCPDGPELLFYDVVRMIYSNGRLISYDIGRHHECDIWQDFFDLDFYIPIAYPKNKRWPRSKIIME